MPYSVAVSSIGFDHKPSGFEYAMRNGSFQNLELELTDLMAAISVGQSYGAWLLDNKQFIKSSVISLDLEGGHAADIDSATQVEFFQDYGALAYTSMSHTETDPRCRLVFLLDAPITSAEDYRDTVSAVATMWPREVVDKQSAQPTQRFLGNPSGKMLVFGKVLVRDVADALCHALRNQRKLAKTPPQSQRIDTPGSYTGPKQAPAFLLTALNELATTAEGGRAIKLNKVAFMFGKFAVAPGHMSETTARGIVTSAGMSAGLSERECDNIVPKSLRAGINIGATHQQ